MNIFIADIHETQAVLNAEESWHCARVLRKKAGDKIRVINGRGSYFEAELSVVSESKTLATLLAGPFADRPRGYYLHLAIAPTKQMDRIEWMVEKAVEIGVDELSFIICRNSERTVIKTDRIQKIIESAVKQSLQAAIPKLNSAVELKKFIASANGDNKFIAHCFDTEKAPLNQVDFISRSTLVMIGPEGDFSPDEVESAHSAGFRPLSLGETRLRTETAGLYVCQAASLLAQLKAG